MRAQKKGGETTTRRSPLYTGRNAELAKRTIIQDQGRDLDGSYRAYKRIDDPRTSKR
jgi:hypothetical protein